MNKPIDGVRIAEALLTSRDSAEAPQDRLGMAEAALTEVMAKAHEVGDWHALRVLHSLTALLAATKQ